MKRIAQFSIVIPALFLMLFVLGIGLGYSQPAENMRFDPLPQEGDTVVSGICGQTPNCSGPVAAFLYIEAPEEWSIIGEGCCVDGRFTINLCEPFESSGENPTICLPYALKTGDVIGVGQWVEVVEGTPCDETPYFTVGRGIPTVTQWGVVILSVLLALSAIVLIRKRRVRLD